VKTLAVIEESGDITDCAKAVDTEMKIENVKSKKVGFIKNTVTEASHVSQPWFLEPCLKVQAQENPASDGNHLWA